MLNARTVTETKEIFQHIKLELSIDVANSIIETLNLFDDRILGTDTLNLKSALEMSLGQLEELTESDEVILLSEELQND